MDNIYNFLKNAWQDLIKETKDNPSFLFILLLLITIPLSLAINNICLILFILFTIANRPKDSFYNSKELLFPVFFFFIMVASYFWSIDKELTLKAIPKEITLLLIPLSFFIAKPLSRIQKEKVFNYFSFAMAGYAFFYLFRAFVKFLVTKETSVFFYHGEYDFDYGLVPKELNAIHFSVFIGVAYFHFIRKEQKQIIDKAVLALLFGFTMLLSSKNIILIFFFLNLVYLFFYTKSSNKMRLRNLTIISLVVVAVLSFGKIKERFLLEFQANTAKSISSNVIKNLPTGIHNVSIYEAWNNEKFKPNDFFPGTAFRVYQARLFFEFLEEDNIFWKGFGLNASYKKLEEKGEFYNVFSGNNEFEGYQKKNFHNQYIQTFAELGLIGFLLLIVILLINTKRAFKNKDFMHIAFAILMISLFLTESFLWRQRGIVFFTMFYCLFNSVEKLAIKEKNNL